MHKKLASDLTSLAHGILQMKNREDVYILKQKAYEVYEKLTLLAYVEEYINTTPQAEESKENLIGKIAEAARRKESKISGSSIKSKEDIIEEELVDPIEEKIETKKENIEEHLFDEFDSLLFNDKKNKIKDEASFIEETKSPTLEEELKDTFPVDVMADLFQKVDSQKTVNDQLQNSTIQIELNDRIVFVKHLFNGNQNDFNRIVSQLNTFKTEKEAKNFVNKIVKPDYDWSEKEEYENRFTEIIERHFS